MAELLATLHKPFDARQRGHPHTSAVSKGAHRGSTKPLFLVTLLRVFGGTMRLTLLPVFLATTVAFGSAWAQELAFGSETWRGHGLQVRDVPLACRVFSNFGNGDKIAFVALMQKGSDQILFMAFLSPSSLDTGSSASPTSVGPVLDKLSASPSGTFPTRAWVDDDVASGVEGSVHGKSLGFTIGTLDTPRVAKFFNGVRDGAVLHVGIAGQDRKYVLRGSFAALSELIGCAVKARDGEILPSTGMPPSRSTYAAIPPQTPAPQPPAATQPVASAVPQPPARVPSRELASSGSGFVVTNDGHILTNHHVVKDCTSFGARSVGGEERRATLLAQDAQNDLALLKGAEAYPEVAVLRVEPPRLAESVLVYGFPLAGLLASSGNVTLGNISALTGLRDDSRNLQITAAVQPGNSGGPLFDGSGLLLGVVQSKFDAIMAASITGDIAQNVNFAIRGSLVASFLGANGIEPNVERRRAALPADEVSEHARKVTVQVLCYRGDH